ncbi:MAG: peptide deformylase [Gemmataceae bacterium]|nr:peptide deformylase [Gemmataceae bacterium]
MPLEIAQLGQPVLRAVAQEVPLDRIAGADFQEFVAAMLETLEYEKGAGLAAPQVFVGLRVFLAGIHPAPAEGELPGIEVFINPTITPLGAETISAWEGCLSFPELLVLVPRPRAMRVEYVDLNGEPVVRELKGFAARVVQHEFDHLEGILTIDRAASTRDIIKASEIDTVREEEE